MKKTTFLVLLSVFLVNLSLRAQCTESAFGFGNNINIGSYNVTGEVTVTLNLDDTVTINLGSDFSVAAGPDVRLFFINSDGASDSEIRNGVADDFEHIQFALLDSFSGNQSFTANIPEGTDISNFDKVYFFCLEYEQFWDFGTVNPFTPTSCAVLSTEVLNTEDFTQNDFELFPNPATNAITISQEANSSRQLQIVDTSGKLLLEQQLEVGVGQETLNISQLSTGIYFVTVSDGQTSQTRKLAVR